MSMDNKILGAYGELLAAEFLQRKGYIILEKNFKNKLGEIDIIVRDGDVLCFVEVKSRKSLACGMPYESVHYFKQRKILNVALSYMKFKRWEGFARFDVVSVYKNADGEPKIEHIVNAFDAADVS